MIVIELGQCEETVSLLWAAIFGADGACLDLSPWSMLLNAGVLIIAVPVIKFALLWVLSLFDPWGKRGLRSPERGYGGEPADGTVDGGGENKDHSAASGT